MGYVVELFFDDETDIAVRRVWDDLAHLGIADSPAGHGARPHISISSSMELDRTRFIQEMTNFGAKAPAIPIEFLSVSAFLTGEGVVFLAPAVTTDLLELHRSLIGLMEECGATIPGYYHPGHWVPHCTLAVNLSGELICRAISHCQQQCTSIHGQIVEIGLVEVSITNNGMCESVRLTNG